MKYGLSTRLFASERLTSRLLGRILEAGFSEIEVFAARDHLDYHDPTYARDLGQWFSDFNIKLHSLHAPLSSEAGAGRRGGFMISVAYAERRRRIDSMDEIKRALEVAERAPFSYLVLHLGLEGEEYSLDKFDAAFTSIEHLRIFAKERGVRLLLENTVSELGNPPHLMQFLSYTRLDDVGICFDAGHARLTGGALEGLGALKDRMVTAHLHDNHGEKDEHLLPMLAAPGPGESGQGGIDWPRLMAEMARAGSGSDGLCSFLELQHEQASLREARDAASRLRGMEAGREVELSRG
ncbi:MAG TPA: sugar phosphate isomerase/epimerase family protein [Terriglobia bacterium]|nr:sugar phosphate isomerase/epimerase family protein [Terriglobia bacterium]